MAATHMEVPGLWRRPWRAAKTVFFVFSMVGSLLVFSAPPLLVAILDIVVPTTILNSSFSSSSSSLSLTTVLAELRRFEFRKSLVDVPLLSVARSVLILCVYSACDVPGRSRGPYLGLTTLCSVASAAYAVAKASAVFGGTRLRWRRLGRDVDGPCAEAAAMLAISAVLAAAHLVVACRTSRRERRKLLVYRIDLEAVSLSKIGLDYHKSCK